MINIGDLLKKAKSDYNNIFKCTVYLVDMGDFEKVNGVYRKFFTGDFLPELVLQLKSYQRKVQLKHL
jgi:2-iminobutanoate/2-iminopropanoate deaminase